MTLLLRLSVLFLSFAAPAATLYAQRVDFPADVLPVLQQRCAGCHGFAASYQAITNGSSSSYGSAFVIPGDAENSPLFDKVRLDRAPRFGSRMPQGGSLSQTQVNLIRDWINQGATATNAGTEQPAVQRFTLIGNFPNPFNPGTTVSFELAAAASVTVEVFAITGQPVMKRQLSAAAGNSTLYLDFSGQATGLYLYRVTAAASGGIVQTATRTLLYLK